MNGDWYAFAIACHSAMNVTKTSKLVIHIRARRDKGTPRGLSRVAFGA